MTTTPRPNATVCASGPKPRHRRHPPGQRRNSPRPSSARTAGWFVRWLPTILTTVMLAVIIVAGISARAERRQADAAAASTACREHQMMLLHVDLFQRIDRHEGQPHAAAIALAEWRAQDASRHLENVRRC